ncbi:FUSC family protein [Agromyces bracchium]|uniref:FUSC family protein n=1 Tax=Agromyces bracchium TaxID=88376 RepID=A0A6I3LZ10_9MICO|nr:FUSC family protein [Agromyces bracchium]MTH67770.1 FUSC family protein [Agromyces bracchium]
MRFSERFRATRRAPILQVLKSAVATVAAWLLAGWLIPGPLPVFAAIAALLVVQPSVNQSLGKALERSVGVIAGVVIASALGLIFGPTSWVILVAILVALVAAWAARMTAPTANQVAISAMLVLALGGTSPEYALDRVLETLIGAAIGIVVNAVIVPPVLSGPAREQLARLGSELAASVDRLASALLAPQRPADLTELMLEVRLMRPMRDAAGAAIADAEESLTLNPRRSAHRGDIAEQRRLLARLSPIVTQVGGMTRAFVDHYDEGLATEPTVRAIAEQLHRVAHDIRLAVHLAEVDPEPLTSVIPALTAPLQIAAPKSEHWILMGSLLEDLRRIREELLEDEVDTGPPS